MLNFIVYGVSLYAPLKFRLGLALKSRLPMLDLCFLACLAREQLARWLEPAH
jgi:hypothetical protein